MRATHYRGSIDGDIKAYLKEMHENGAVNPSFTGYEPFKQMWDLGFMDSYVASIRLVHGACLDEHYYVVDEHHLEGAKLKDYSGKEGLHNTKDILTNTQAKFWEISMLKPKAYRG